MLIYQSEVYMHMLGVYFRISLGIMSEQALL